jgi:cell division septum initiation protein DivIVA
VEREYRNIHEENLRLKKQIKEFEAQFEEAIQRLDQRD